jgi:hypothetical protein
VTRSTSGNRRQWRGLEEDNHVYEDFYVKEVGPVINATTYENPTLSEAYIQSLKDTYSSRLFDQEVLAKRLNISEGGIYYAFNASANVAKTSYQRGFPIYVGMDFNVNPMSAVVGQLIEDKLYVIDEFYLEHSNTSDMARRIKEKYGSTNVFIIPDSTGSKTTTNSSRSDHEILRSYGFTVKSAANPFRIDRYAAVNVNFEKNKIVVDNKCKYLIRDLEQVNFKEGTNQPDTSNKMLTHVSDALGYLVYRTINPFQSKSKIQSFKR